MSEILGKWLWCDWVPPFFVNLYAAIKLTEEKVATSIKLLNIFRLHFVRHFVKLEYLFLAALWNLIFWLFPIVFAKLILIRDRLLCHLNGNKSVIDSRILATFQLMHFKMYLVSRILLVRILSPQLFLVIFQVWDWFCTGSVIRWVCKWIYLGLLRCRNFEITFLTYARW